MDPTLKDGQHVMVNILGYKVGNIKKEMLLSSMLINLMTMLKRVIGVPGDSVTYKKISYILMGKK